MLNIAVLFVSLMAIAELYASVTRRNLERVIQVKKRIRDFNINVILTAFSVKTLKLLLISDLNV